MGEKKTTDSGTTKGQDTAIWATDLLRELANRVNAGEPGSMEELRSVLQKFPWISSAMGGDLALQAETSLVNVMGGDQIGFKESLHHDLEQMRAELAGANPTPLERLLVERVVDCWLQVLHADCVSAQAKEISLNTGD